jgi:hypothetical protein
MGGEGLDERVFATFDRVRDHGGVQWWLYLSRCGVCSAYWMVAQEERIYDDYFLRRLSAEETAAILTTGDWPADFLTYEQVLMLGRERSRPCVFFERFSPALVDTIADLRRERPAITAAEIAHLLGISPGDVAHMVR